MGSRGKHVGAGFVALTLMATLAGCQPEGARPVVSVDDARKIQASMQGQQAFTPPARTISDITAILDEYKPDPAKVAQYSRLVDAVPPAGAAPRELADFHYRRSDAAGHLGRRQQQLDDLREAVRVARTANLGTNSYLRHLMTAEMLAGNTRNALRIAEERLVDVNRDGPLGAVAASYAALSLLRLRMGDMDGARAAMQQAERPLANPRFTSLPAYPYVTAEPRSQIMRGWGQIAEESGDYEKAEEYYRRNLGDMQWIRQSEAQIRSYLPETPADALIVRDIALGGDLSRLLRKQGRLVEAEAEARRVLIVALRHYGRYAVPAATAITNLAAVIYEQGRIDEAVQLADTALGIYEQLGAGRGSHWVAALHSLRARAKTRQKDYEGALASWQAAAAVFPENDVERYLHVESKTGYGNVLMRVGRTGDAVRLLQRLADDRRGRLGDRHYETAEARGFLGAALAKAGQAEKALAEFRAAVPLLLQVSRQSEDGDSAGDRDFRLQAIIEAYIELLAQMSPTQLAGIDVPAETFRVADAIRAHGVQRALAASAARAAVGDPALQQLARQEQDAQKQISAFYGLLNDVLASPANQQDPGAIRKLREQIDRLRDARAVLRQEIERRFPDYVNLIDPRPQPPAEVQALLRPGEVLVSLYVGADNTFVWAVPARGPVAFAVAPVGEKKITAMVTDLRRALDPNAATLGDIPAYDVGLARQLHSALLQPVEAALKGAESLLIVPDKALGQLPFALLVTQTAAVPADGSGALFSGYRKVPFLIRDVAVVQLPSVAALATLRRSAPAPASRRAFAGFGDPWFSTEQAREASAVSSATLATRGAGLQTRAMPLLRRNAPATQTAANADLAMLPRLPDTADEVRSVAAALRADGKTDIFLGADASEQRVKTMPLADRKVVMFATHGLVAGDLNGLAEPALALSAPAVTGTEGDGLLTMAEILGLRLNADWVVLSACNTATGEGAGAEAVSGLGRAFFYAGTRAVLVTNWPVETTSAKELTTDLFLRQSGDSQVTRAQAMRQSMLQLIDGDGYVDGGKTVFSYAHPIFWAPFSLVGDGGR